MLRGLELGLKVFIRDAVVVEAGTPNSMLIELCQQCCKERVCWECI